jgi:hypothetical protein
MLLWEARNKSIIGKIQDTRKALNVFSVVIKSPALREWKMIAKY